MKRIAGIDITRGIVMIIMALDHVRDFLHTSSMTNDPLNLETTTVLLFMTRWVTHLCAPAFVFLAGISAYISMRRTGNVKITGNYLLTRGLWLVVLEFTLINFALWFDIRFSLLILEVIGAIGFSFIMLSLLCRFNARIVGVAGITLILVQSYISGLPLPENQVLAFIASVLYHPSLTQLSEGHSLYTAYPVLPWLGIMLTGYWAGQVYDLSPEKRKQVLIYTGLALIAAFMALRALNFYGNPLKWSVQASPDFTLLSFINVAKYPPSLLFTVLFTGFTLVLLAVSDKLSGRFASFAVTYGRTPLFYFVVHLYLIHSLMFVVLFVQGFGAGDFAFGLFKNGRPDAGGGIGLGWVYLIWIAVVLMMYPLCGWYGRFKAGNQGMKFLRYL